MRQPTPFSLTLFSTKPAFIQRAVAAGVDEIIVDWEHVGKAERQRTADTEINQDTLTDLRGVRACTRARVICRINQFGAETSVEVEHAIDAGADEILLPMVRSVDQVRQVLDLVGQRCGVGILVETNQAIQLVEQLALLPLSRVYVGLNDLAIERRQSNIFNSLLDGSLDFIRQPFRVPFGFGGLTLPENGFPIPCRLLIGEMARLNCTFSFLRRSFYRDIDGRDLRVEIPALQAALRAASVRSQHEIHRDRTDLESAIRAWSDQMELRQGS
jgi:hypothetical protein